MAAEHSPFHSGPLPSELTQSVGWDLFLSDYNPCSFCLQSQCTCWSFSDNLFFADVPDQLPSSPFQGLDSQPPTEPALDVTYLNGPTENQPSARSGVESGTNRKRKRQASNKQTASPRPKFKRTTIPDASKKILEESFQISPYVRGEALARLSVRTQLTPDAIRIWFGNARSRKDTSERRCLSGCSCLPVRRSY